VHTALLTVHVLAGAVGLLIAWPVLLVRKGRAHRVLGRVYGVTTMLLCASALGLWAYRPAELAGFAGIAVGTAMAAGAGIALAMRRPRGWLVPHLTLMGSSVIAFVTAFAVQMTDFSLLAWILPTVLGSPLIAYRTMVAKGVAPPPGKLAQLVINRLPDRAPQQAPRAG
jgi:hypothetical protein